MNLADYKGVLVYIEQRDGEIQKVSLELLGKGKELAEKLGEKLSAVVLGHNIKTLADELIYHGAEKVITVDHEVLKNFTNEPYTKALTAVINNEKPAIVLVGATSIGRDIAPRVSARIHTGLTADCTSLDIDDETRNLMMTRPAFGGNIMATIICPDHRPQMSTVRPGVMLKLERNTSNTGDVIDFDADLNAQDLNVEVLEIGGRNIDRDISYIYDLNLETSKNLKENFSLAHKENASTSEIIECITKNEEKIKIRITG